MMVLRTLSRGPAIGYEIARKAIDRLSNDGPASLEVACRCTCGQLARSVYPALLILNAGGRLNVDACIPQRFEAQALPFRFLLPCTGTETIYRSLAWRRFPARRLFQTLTSRI